METEESKAALQLDHSPRLNRRRLLHGIGAGVVGVSLAACSSNSNKSNNSGKASTSGAATSAAGTSGGSPAASSGTPTFTVPQGASLSILLWSHFVPAFDTFIDKFATDWGQQNNVKVTVDHVSIDDLPARLAAEVAARKGHDLFGFSGQIKTRSYEKELVDFNDIVDGLAKLYGDPIPIAKSLGVVNGKWKIVPDFGILQPPLVRTDLLKKLGLNKPTTWDELRQTGAKLKAGGNPCGLAVSHCNDANHNWRTIMNSFGAHEVGDDGKTLTADSKEMRDFLTFAVAFGKEANNTPEVFAWDNASDNRSLASGQAGFIHDAISGLRSIQPQNKELYDNIDVLPELKGPARQIHVADFQTWAMWSFTPKGNQEAGKAFLWYYSTHQKETNTASTGYNHPMFTKQFDKPMPVIGEDPKYNILQDYKGDLLQTYGYPGPPNAAAEEVLSQFIIPDTVAKVQQGASIDDGIKFMVGQLKSIYAKYA